MGNLDNRIFFRDDPRYTDELYSEYRMLNVKTHTEYTGKFEDVTKQLEEETVRANEAIDNMNTTKKRVCVANPFFIQRTTNRFSKRTNRTLLCAKKC